MYPPGTRILLLGMDDPHHPVPPVREERWITSMTAVIST